MAIDPSVHFQSIHRSKFRRFNKYINIYIHIHIHIVYEQLQLQLYLYLHYTVLILIPILILILILIRIRVYIQYIYNQRLIDGSIPIISIIGLRFFSSGDHRSNRYFLESIDYRYLSNRCFFAIGTLLQLQVPS